MGRHSSSSYHGGERFESYGAYRDYPNTVYYNDRPYRQGRGPTFYVRENVTYDDYGRPTVYRRGVDNRCRIWPLCCCFPCIPCCFPIMNN